MSYREHPTEDYEFYVRKNRYGGYEVSLPHQCDEWKVLGWDQSSYTEPHDVAYESHYPANPTDKAFAVQQMELFVKRAQEALEKLKAL